MDQAHCEVALKDIHGLGSPWVNLRNKEHQAKIFDHILNCVGYWTDFPGNRAFTVGCDYMQGPHIHGNPQGEWCGAQLSWLSLYVHNSSGVGRCTHFACFSCSRHCLAQKSKAREPCWVNDRICFGHMVILNKRAWRPYGPCSSVLWIAMSHLGKSSSLLGSGHRKQWVFLDTRCLCYLISFWCMTHVEWFLKIAVDWTVFSIAESGIRRWSRIHMFSILNSIRHSRIWMSKKSGSKGTQVNVRRKVLVQFKVKPTSGVEKVLYYANQNFVPESKHRHFG